MGFESESYGCTTFIELIHRYMEGFWQVIATQIPFLDWTIAKGWMDNCTRKGGREAIFDVTKATD